MFSQFIFYNLCNIQLIKMSFFGVELNSQVNRLILQIRLKLAQNKLSPNFRTLYRSFVKYDPQTSGLISATLFEKALNQNGLFFKKFQIQAFQKAFLNQIGAINWFAFLQHLREPMGPYRRQVVQQIFDEISEAKNEATIAQLKQRFNPEGCDNFKKVVKDQKANFQGLLGLVVFKEGKLTRDQFIAYYDDISINFPQDDAFARFVCHQWQSQLKKPQKWTQQQLKQAIKAFRFKLIQKTKGTNDQFLLRKIFNEFDPNKNQLIGAYELDLTLKRLDLPLPSKLIAPLLDQLDKNKSGYIEYDQFKKFIFFDPFQK